MSSRLVTALCVGVLAAYVVLLGAQVGREDGWPFDDRGRPTYTDFIVLWGAGQLTLEGRPADAYDVRAHTAAMSDELGRDVSPIAFAYPPTFLAVIAPFAKLPYLTSMLVWASITLGIYAWVLARIVGRPEGAIWMLAPIVTLANFNVGQNGFVTAALLGGGLLLLRTRPIVAGVVLGALSIKPHLGLLVPVALMASGNWRAFGAAAITVTAMIGASIVAWGGTPWLGFFVSLTTFGSEVASDAYSLSYKLQSAYGLLVTLGLSRELALGLHAIFAVAVAGLVAWMWRSRAAFELKAALLAVGAVLTSPYVFIYDLTMLAVAQAFLVAYGLKVGFGRWDGLVIVAVNVVLFVFVAVKLPTGFVAGLLLCAWVLLQARSDWMSVSWGWPQLAGPGTGYGGSPGDQAIGRR